MTNNIKRCLQVIIALAAFSLSCLFLARPSEPASHVTPVASIEVSGVVVAEKRNDTLEGICHISEYYVIVTDAGERYVLNSQRDSINADDDFTSFEKSQEQFKRLVGQRIKVTGEIQTLKLSGGSVCTWIRVSSILGLSGQVPTP